LPRRRPHEHPYCHEERHEKFPPPDGSTQAALAAWAVAESASLSSTMARIFYGARSEICHPRRELGDSNHGLRHAIREMFGRAPPRSLNSRAR
jgi:hypothetical protein